MQRKVGKSIFGSRALLPAYKVQHLGNEAGLPTLADIVTAEWEFTDNNAYTR